MAVITGFLERLARGPVLFDGAMGSLLLAEGLPPGAPPELWNVERPEVITRIHRAYAASGAEVMTTNTFGATSLKLSPFGLAGRAEELNFAAVRLAMAVRLLSPDRGLFIAGDIGPCGKFFPPVGDLTETALIDSVKAQVEILAAAGVDLLLIETMVDVREAEMVVRTARQVSDIPVAVTMTFDKKPRGYFTIMGDTPGEAVRRLADAGADLVGANCTLAAGEMVPLAGILVAESPVPVLVQPNAGRPEFEDGRAIYHVTPGEFAAALMEMCDLGVAAIGGCCGTTPEHLRAVAEAMRTRSDEAAS